MTWTPERVERLKVLWAQGLTASEVASALGLKSRNAVIGKVHRLGISKTAKQTPKKRAPVGPKTWSKDRTAILLEMYQAGHSDADIAEAVELTPTQVAAKRRRLKLPIHNQHKQRGAIRKRPKRAHITNRNQALAEANRKTQGLRIDQLRPNQCRWATNEPPLGGDYVFCGDKIEPGKPYCAAHCAIAYRPTEDAA